MRKKSIREIKGSEIGILRILEYIDFFILKLFILIQLSILDSYTFNIGY